MKKSTAFSGFQQNVILNSQIFRDNKKDSNFLICLNLFIRYAIFKTQEGNRKRLPC